MAEFGAHTASIVAKLEKDDVPVEVTLIIEQQVVDADDNIVENFHVQIARGRVEVIDGPAENADVTIRQDVDTARGLQAGTTHAQRAFLTGQLSIDGDIDQLLAHGALLNTLVRGANA